MAHFTENHAKVTNIIDAFSKVNSELPAQQMRVFLAVAANEGRTMPELIEATGMLQGTFSRNVKALADDTLKPSKTNPEIMENAGLGLLTKRHDPFYRNRKAVFLTEKGRELLLTLDRLAA